MTSNTVPTTGPISSDEIVTYLGGPTPFVLENYYQGSTYVPSGAPQNANVPTSGAISLQDLYGATSIAPPTPFNFTATISANTTNYNIASAASAAGWNGTDVLYADVTVEGGVVVAATGTGAYAFTVPTLPANSTVSITVDGYILGAGGAGGNGGTSTPSNYNVGNTGGAAGGPALLIQYPTVLNGSGTIGGGGGGGGGGRGGILPEKGTSYFLGGGGGGGGGGSINGPGGAGGGASGGYNDPGAPGAAGSNTGGGAGGSSVQNPNAAPNSQYGGSGGSLGNAGTSTNTVGGGPAGHAIDGIGNLNIGNFTGSILGATA